MESVSICILNYNGLQHISQLIEDTASMKAEVLVLDNNSTDGSKEFLQKLHRSKRIRLIENKSNEGYSKGKNRLVKAAKGKYILLLDEDLRIHDKSALQKLLALHKKIEPGFISVLLVNSGEKETTYIGGYWSVFGYSSRKKIEMEQFSAYEGECYPCHAPEGGAIFFARKHFLDLGGYDLAQPYYSDVGDIGIRSFITTGKANVCTTKIHFIHTGIDRKQNLEAWLWKFQYIPSGTLRILFKNFQAARVALHTPTILLFFAAGSIYKGLVFRSFKPIMTYFRSLLIFLKDFPNMLATRKRIQRVRVKSDSAFLRYRPLEALA